MKNLLLASIAVIALFFIAASFGGGKAIIGLPNGIAETDGQKHWYASPTGTGDCTTLVRACSFRTAVTKCTDTITDIIHVGPGDHELDNLSDATGTTIAAKYVVVVGSNYTGFGHPSSRLVNGDAAATKVLTVTSDGFAMENILFNADDQADTDVTHLTLSGVDGANLRRVHIHQSVGAAGIGILIDTASTSFGLDELHIHGLLTYGIQTNSATDLVMINSIVSNCGKGIYISGGADDDDIHIHNFEFSENTTGIETVAATLGIHLQEPKFIHNTVNVVDGGAWDELHITRPEFSHRIELTYPVEVGVSVNTGDGAWAWTAAATTIIAADIIDKPFIIESVNIQSADASQTYKLELLYGDATADTQAGIFSFSVGPNVTGKTADIKMQSAIPTNSIVGIKLMSSTAGVDTIVVGISYIQI